MTFLRADVGRNDRQLTYNPVRTIL